MAANDILPKKHVSPRTRHEALSAYETEASYGFLKECDDPIVGFAPTPIRSDLVQLVDQVPITENSWHKDISILEVLRPLVHRSFPSRFHKSDQPVNEEQLVDTADDSCTEPSGDDSSCTEGLMTFPLEPWNEKYKALKSFYQSYGHVNVSQNYKDDPSLIQWVKRQRYQHKLKAQGRHSPLTNQREELLEQLGFVWEWHASVWEDRLAELRAFAEVHGHCMVPTKYPVNQPLAVWVKCQRRQYKLFLSRRKSTITIERIKTLSSLGFVFNPRNLKKKSVQGRHNTIHGVGRRERARKL